MIELRETGDRVSVLIAGNEINIQDAEPETVFAECDFEKLCGESNSGFPAGLILEVRSDDGFGTDLFFEANLIGEEGRLLLHLVCNEANEYWEGKYGLRVFLGAIANQVSFHDGLTVVEEFLTETYKGLTIESEVPSGANLSETILRVAGELKLAMREADVALAGGVWDQRFETDEAAFCTDLLLPLFRRMGFLNVRYRHGVKEYGKDFTFSEMTPFRGLRHYGVQAKAGSLSGGVNSAIDEIIGQIHDGFAMPYYELGSSDPRYVSTFIVAVSGSFTGNAKDKLAEKIPTGLTGSILFLDRESIAELVERYWLSKLRSDVLGARVPSYW
jgi:hypothetical protein